MDSEQFASIMSGIAEIRTEQDSMRRELLGNGQPGRIQRIETDVVNLKEEQVNLDKVAWKLGTLSAGAGSVGTLVLQWLGKKLFHI